MRNISSLTPEQLHEIDIKIKTESNRRIESAKTSMQNLLTEQPDGIKLGNLYETLEEQGFDEHHIRPAFLDLVGTHKIDIDISEKRFYKVVLVTE